MAVGSLSTNQPQLQPGGKQTKAMVSATRYEGWYAQARSTSPATRIPASIYVAHCIACIPDRYEVQARLHLRDSLSESIRGVAPDRGVQSNLSVRLHPAAVRRDCISYY